MRQIKLHFVRSYTVSKCSSTDTSTFSSPLIPSLSPQPVHFGLFFYIFYTKLFTFELLTNLLGRYARVVDHLAVRNVAQGAPRGGGSTLHPLGQHSTAFDGEIEAIRTALRPLNLHKNKFERAVIFSDSKAAILSAVSTEAKDCQALIRQLKAKHKQILLQWIPGHSQIAGNEYADTLAKKGAKITQTHIRETSYHSIKLHFKTSVPKCVQTRTRDKAVSKTMDASISQNTGLAKKKGSFRVSIVRWA